MDHLPGKFVWFEHASSDVARARAFYKALLGWEVERTPHGYEMIVNEGHAIGGMRSVTPGKPSHWASYVSVDDVSGRFDTAIAAGAKPSLPPTDFVPAGRGASITDPTGAQLWLWKGATPDRSDDRVPAVGDWCWAELCTPDAARSLAFYERLLGYVDEPSDRGPGPAYYLLKMAGRMRAGMVELAEAPSLWLPYVRVRDCDASVARARTLGAPQIVAGPADIRDVGRFAVAIDPLGATVGFMQLE
jgi:predicted enzyme related to lactoylglutathione lyase